MAKPYFMPEQFDAPHLSATERFDRIYLNSFDILYHYVRKNIREQHIVADILQETYKRLWENLHSIRDDEKILALLKTYSTNIIINTIQQQQRNKLRAQQYAAQQELISPGEDLFNLKETMRQYKEVIDTFPPQRRMVFLLKKEQGLSHREIAEQLNISVFTIDRHINASLKTLRSTLLVSPDRKKK